MVEIYPINTQQRHIDMNKPIPSEQAVAHADLILYDVGLSFYSPIQSIRLPSRSSVLNNPIMIWMVLLVYSGERLVVVIIITKQQNHDSII
jgi:hypothetical protein